MIDSEKAKKLGADKIVLLGLFALSLLIARVIVAAKRTVVLSKPIELKQSGLSVRLPDKNGWQSQKEWKFQQNSFFLSSSFNPGTVRVSANIKCSYLLAADRESPQQWLEQRMLEFDAENRQSGEVQAEGLTFYWTSLTEISSKATMLAATAQLPDGRWLDIEIIETAGESRMPLRVFEKIVAHLSFDGNELLGAGRQVVEQIKQAGLNRFISSQQHTNFFIIKNAAGRDIGFTIDGIAQAETGDGTEFEGTGFLYIKSRYATEEASFFQCDDDLGQFSWQSQSQYNNRIHSTELSLSHTQMLSVIGTTRDGSERRYLLGPAAFPDAVVEVLFSRMIDEKLERIMVDMVYSDGQIKPVVISVEPPKQPTEEAAYVIKLYESDQGRAEEEVYLDSRMNVVKRIIRKSGIYVMQRSTLEEVLGKFPERADFIIQRSKTIDGQKKDSHEDLSDDTNTIL